MSSLIDHESNRLFSMYTCPTPPVLLRYSIQQSNRRGNDIERLKRRVDSLVKSNDEKEKKIEDLQNQLAKYNQTLTAPKIEIKTKELNGDLSDTNSIPSISSEKDSLTQNEFENPLNKLKLDVLHRASSAEPMLIRELSHMPLARRSIGTLNPHYDQTGYISDGADHRYSICKSKSSNTKSLKNLFGKLIRTNSGQIREESNRAFKTITNNKLPPKALNPLEQTFSRWTSEQIVNWLYGIGLGQYASECRKAFQNGLQLLNATPQELDKKMGMRNPLHRKKLQLCLNGLSTKKIDGANLDTYWVLKWLDDIGLPQYKQSFSESKIDGRLLNNLSLEDLIYLNITNELHHLCLKRSIEVLRMNNFNSNYIKRRPDSNEKSPSNGVIFWSNYRVMDWLRSIDLAEYAANLRGSGVCGALIILEIRFNVSTLADILSIPISKSLLRKHLTMRFQELIGDEIQTRKNIYERSADYQPLALNTKVKIRNGFFAQRRTRSFDNEELICPMNENRLTANLKFALSHDSPTTVV